ncbi:hypothetical protein WJU16_21925 [Chitinophaga pollutisoli]|uniref:Uncharacterized protein n=1 Tax=Chitinophaga pollutisoli TaxID=3133966 RepID=A0ABZ2YNY2_9BACT
MKNRILSLAVLAIAAVGAFAFKAQPTKRVGVLYDLVSASANPLLSASYKLSSIDPATCPNAEGKVCVIDIPATDVIPAGQPNAGKPNFTNTAATNDLVDELSATLSTAAGTPTTASFGRVFHERN